MPIGDCYRATTRFADERSFAKNHLPGTLAACAMAISFLPRYGWRAFLGLYPYFACAAAYGAGYLFLPVAARAAWLLPVLAIGRAAGALLGWWPLIP